LLLVINIQTAAKQWWRQTRSYSQEFQSRA